MNQSKHAGDTIVQVRGDFYFDCHVVTPGPGKLFTFRVGDLLVMDDYGDDRLPSRFRKRIWNHLHTRQDPAHAFCVLNTKTGEIGSGWLHEAWGDTENDPVKGICLEVSLFTELIVPKRWLGKVVAGVRGQKRPYRFALDEQSLYSFMDRSIGFTDLDPYVEFDLGGNSKLAVHYAGWVQVIQNNG